MSSILPDQFQNQFQGLLCEKFHKVWGGAAGDDGLKNSKKKYQQADKRHG